MAAEVVGEMLTVSAQRWTGQMFVESTIPRFASSLGSSLTRGRRGRDTIESVDVAPSLHNYYLILFFLSFT